MSSRLVRPGAPLHSCKGIPVGCLAALGTVAVFQVIPFTCSKSTLGRVAPGTSLRRLRYAVPLQWERRVGACASSDPNYRGLGHGPLSVRQRGRHHHRNHNRRDHPGHRHQCRDQHTRRSIGYRRGYAYPYWGDGYGYPYYRRRGWWGPRVGIGLSFWKQTPGAIDKSKIQRLPQ